MDADHLPDTVREGQLRLHEFWEKKARDEAPGSTTEPYSESRHLGATQQSGNALVDTILGGNGVVASIFRASSAQGEHYSVTFERRYKDKLGKWRVTLEFDPDDFTELTKVAAQAHTRILELKQLPPTT